MGVRHRADTLAALLCGPTALAHRGPICEERQPERRRLGERAGGVRTKDSGSPPPQSCQPQMPRTLPQGRRHTVRGTLASLGHGPAAFKQALFGELRSAPGAVRILCAKAPNVARVAGSSTFSSAAPLLRRPNGRLGESAHRHSLALPLRFCKGCKRLRGPFSFALSPLCFWCFVPPNSAPKCPGRSPTPT